jgi:hypothetical protein
MRGDVTQFRGKPSIMKKLSVIAGWVLWAALSLAQTNVNGSRTFLGNVDAAKATGSRLLTGNGAPGSGCSNAKAITSSTNATPIVVTSSSHGYSNGDVVTIYGHATNTAANGTWMVGSATTNTFALCGYWDGATCQNGAAGNGVGGNTGFVSTHVGRLYFRNDTTAGQNLYMCTDATGSPAWVQQSVGGNGSTLLNWQKAEGSSFAANGTDQIVATSTIASIPNGKCVAAHAKFWLLTGSSATATIKWNLGGTGTTHTTISGGTAVAYSAYAGGTNNVVSAHALICNDPGSHTSQQITIEPLMVNASFQARGEDGTAALDTSTSQQLSITCNISSSFNIQMRALEIELLQ